MLAIARRLISPFSKTSFTCEGKETRQKFRMEPGVKLFPAIFFKATSKDAVQFELGRTSNSLPLSSAVLLNSGKHSVPQFPPRLKVSVINVIFVKEKSVLPTHFPQKAPFFHNFFF